ncbi:polyprenyl synthetase family protein [Agromyces archimandritae]|uniref:Polyprenyl synthetase family protein n=1 Tax=Agromyces archimandritae TaxID=2781962 RepID=A0A975FN09_9MICO|nr:polyprenyl synthetase family protein [Agromyces archimandritae]QTX04916.1 polyprenyl synthetase family protein [Agromyces archimandritae]
MAHPFRLVDLVQERIEGFLAERASILLPVSGDLDALIGFSRRFLSGGKRFRAQFCYRGWEAVIDGEAASMPRGSREAIVSAAAALELFHAAALVHDDLIDNSDTRRGAPSAHRLFESEHTASDWAGDAGAFGRSAAILLGDLLLGWSDELLDEGLTALGDPERARAARAAFTTMRTEVTAGQYLDILEEQAWPVRNEAERRDVALRVVVYKSAKYSVEAPLAIGAAIGGATPEQLAALRGYGLPLGIAYQLRDDLLGVFGDPAVTGKPAGDDLREGKRTLLIAAARERLPESARRLLDELLGDPGLDTEQIAMLQRTIADSGAVDELEQMIAERVDEARGALDGAPVAASAAASLDALATSVSRRSR